ncbi:MAG: hypothetical protein Q7R64_02800 [bacterium]|nr:hypothetical protein [bacterium]
MALEATHIRFALDMQKKYAPKDIQKYVAGAIYPDSRYVMGIDRNLTHLKESDREKLLQSDFGKGWHSHLLCDDVQYAVTKELFPEVFTEKVQHGSEGWVKHSALKVLQDMDDVRQFAIGSFLPFLEHLENPNGEEVAKLHAYSQTFVTMYADSTIPTLNDYYEMWRKWGIGEDLALQIRRQVEVYARDAKVMTLISKIYPEALLGVNLKRID